MSFFIDLLLFSLVWFSLLWWWRMSLGGDVNSFLGVTINMWWRWMKCCWLLRWLCNTYIYCYCFVWESWQWCWSYDWLSTWLSQRLIARLNGMRLGSTAMRWIRNVTVIVVYYNLSFSFSCPFINKQSHHMFSSCRSYRAWSWPVEKRWGQHSKIFHLVFFQKSTSSIIPNRWKRLLTCGSSGLPMWSILPAGFNPSKLSNTF